MISVMKWLKAKGAKDDWIDGFNDILSQEKEKERKGKEANARRDDPWKLLQSAKDKMKNITIQSDRAADEVEAAQEKLDAAITWQNEINAKKADVQDDIDYAQTRIAENCGGADDADDKGISSIHKDLLKKVQAYEENLKDIMAKVMSGIPEDAGRKRELYDTIFKFPLDHAGSKNDVPESPFDTDTKHEHGDLNDGTGAFAKPPEQSAFVKTNASDSDNVKGAGKERRGPY